MRSHRFFADIPLECGQIVELPREAAHHCSQVLRYKVSDPLTLFNGDGFDYLATINSINKKTCQVELLSKQAISNESPLSIHLLQGVARGDKMDFIIQKAVELGVTEITPLFSERCNVKLDAKRLAKKMQHWHKVIVSACEQSGRATIPSLHQAIRMEAFIPNSDDLNLILEPTANHSIATLTIDPQANQRINLLVGPEGGFSEKDLSLQQKIDINTVRMGPRILRTETAGLAATAVLQSTYGDLK